MTFAERFGHNLRSARERKGISQERLGERAGLHRTAIGQIERGERIARTDTLVRLAGAIDSSPLEFLEGLSWRPPEDTQGDLQVEPVAAAVGPAK